MTQIREIAFTFVDSAPETLEPGVMYISTRYRAIIHLCLCGCQEKVVLNLDSDPESWRITYDGRSISIEPSIGNVGLPCRSHYVVLRNRVRWLRPLLDVDPKVALEVGRHHVDYSARSRPRWRPRWFPWRREDPGGR